MGKTIIYGIGRIGKKYIDQCILSGVADLKLVDSNNILWGTEYRGLDRKSTRLNSSHR